LNDPLLIVPLVLWLFTYGISAFFHYIVKKKLGAKSEFYADYRMPNFLTNVLNSVVSVGLILFIINRPVPPEYANFIAVPYFGIVAYCTTSAFRAFKEARNG
jgi:predicted neutral ceramidase superfamily lipid hydrolase